MAQKIWTADELERMTPAEQDAIFDASVVRNLHDVPREFLARCGLVSKRISLVRS